MNIACALFSRKYAKPWKQTERAITPIMMGMPRCRTNKSGLNSSSKAVLKMNWQMLPSALQTLPERWALISPRCSLADITGLSASFHSRKMPLPCARDYPRMQSVLKSVFNSGLITFSIGRITMALTLPPTLKRRCVITSCAQSGMAKSINQMQCNCITKAKQHETC